MSFITRAALRIVSRQPSRAVGSLQQHTVRASALSSLQPAVHRSFHLTAAPRAELSEQEQQEQQEQQRDTVEESVASSETADASLTEKAKYAAGNALDSLQAATGLSSGGRRAQANNSTGPSKTVYVGNLLFEVKTADLEAEFSAIGPIANARVVEDNRGMSKGFGFVEFEKQEDAERAVRDLNQQNFNGRNMTVQFHIKRDRPGFNGSTVNKPSSTLFIGNMSYEMSDRDLNDLFREVRDVLDVRVAIDRRTGQPRGFAHADFVSVEAATKAKTMLEGKLVYGRSLRIDFSTTARNRNEDRSQ